MCRKRAGGDISFFGERERRLTGKGFLISSSFLEFRESLFSSPFLPFLTSGLCSRGLFLEVRWSTDGIFCATFSGFSLLFSSLAFSFASFFTVLEVSSSLWSVLRFFSSCFDFSGERDLSRCFSLSIFLGCSL